MKIFITGGSGFVGSFLAKVLVGKGHEVTILTRGLKKGNPLPEGTCIVEGDSTRPGSWQKKVVEHEVIINLSGASIFARWKNELKKKIFDSRILTTNHLVEALADRKGKEALLLSSSGVGYYGFHGDEVLDENNEPGDDFLARVAWAWENAAMEAKKYGVKVVLCRIGIVMGRKGGVLAKLVPIFKSYLGAPFGSGNQWFSWIHEQDLADIFLFLLEHKDLEGPVNCTSPHPVRNKELVKTLGGVLQKTTSPFPVPGFLLKLTHGEFANIFLGGQRVIPQKLLVKGFQFRFPFLEEALNNLIT